jgi:hypothetical protein
MSPISWILFDLGDTPGTAVLSASPARLVRLDVFPFAPGLRKSLRDRGLRLGTISNTGDMTGVEIDAVLAPTGIQDYFEPALRIYSKDVGLTKDSPAIFRLAAQRADLAETPQRCMHVGEDGRERGFRARRGLARRAALAADRRGSRRAAAALYADDRAAGHAGMMAGLMTYNDIQELAKVDLAGRLAVFNLMADVGSRRRTMTLDQRGTYRIRFEDLSRAQSNQAASELRQALRSAAGAEASIEIQKEDPETQDFGSTLILVLATPVAVAIAKGVRDYIAKTGSRVVIETSNGKIVATGHAAANIDIAKTAEAHGGNGT